MWAAQSIQASLILFHLHISAINNTSVSASNRTIYGWHSCMPRSTRCRDALPPVIRRRITRPATAFLSVPARAQPHSPQCAKSPPSLLSPRCQRLQITLPDSRIISLSMRRTYLVPAPTPMISLTRARFDACLSLVAVVSCTFHNYCGYLCMRATATYSSGR
jgi:hypothetical protein